MLTHALSDSNASIVNRTKSEGAPPELIPAPYVRRYEIREPYKLDLLPFVSIGVASVRKGGRHDPPPGYRVACPNDRAYCIDFEASDNGTCMYPDPLEIKRCYDQSCTGSAWAPLIRKQQNEDTYCKDFMTPQGRVCQWLDSVPCSCESRSIYYYSGEFIPPEEPIPYGFTEAHPCTYPLDVIRRAAEEAARKAKRDKQVRRKQRRQRADEADIDSHDSSQDRKQKRQSQRDSSFENSSYLLSATLAASLLIAIVALI